MLVRLQVAGSAIQTHDVIMVLPAMKALPVWPDTRQHHRIFKTVPAISAVRDPVRTKPATFKTHSCSLWVSIEGIPA